MDRGFLLRSISSLAGMWSLNRNSRLINAATFLSGLAQGIFIVVFNLYILEMGINTQVLGGILGAGPLAQSLGSIPLGFLAEVIGFRKIFLLIYGLSGLARLVQVATGSVPLITAAAFAGGLALAGDFVVRLSFLAAITEPQERTRVYATNLMSLSLSVALGSLAAGFLPNLFQALDLDLVIAYRFTLYLAGLLAVAAALPVSRIIDPPRPADRKVSLAPYLWRVDHIALKQAAITLFVGASVGILTPFMNLYFVVHLGSTREYFGVISALTILFILAGTWLAPLIARRSGGVIPAVSGLRMLTSVFLVLFAFTSSQYVGALSHWMQSALFQTAQPMAWAFVMRAAARKAQTAASAWMNTMFWFGQAAVAPIVGSLMDGGDFRTPLLLSAAAVAVSSVLNFAWFNPVERRLNQGEAVHTAGEVPQ